MENRAFDFHISCIHASFMHHIWGIGPYKFPFNLRTVRAYACHMCCTYAICNIKIFAYNCFNLIYYLYISVKYITYIAHK